MEIPVHNFQPKNQQENICLEIAKYLQETDMRFILSCLRKYGIHPIEEAIGIIKEAPAGKIKNPRKYFNTVVRNLGEKYLQQNK